MAEATAVAVCSVNAVVPPAVTMKLSLAAETLTVIFAALLVPPSPSWPLRARFVRWSKDLRRWCCCR